MVSQVAMETINYAKDIDFEYNIKMLIICTLYVYAFIMLWASFKLDLNWFWWKILKVIFRVVGIAWIIFIPLFYLILLRTVSFEIMYTYLLGIYGISFVIILALFKLGFSEFGIRLLGFDVSPKNIRMNNRVFGGNNR